MAAGVPVLRLRGPRHPVRLPRRLRGLRDRWPTARLTVGELACAGCGTRYDVRAARPESRRPGRPPGPAAAAVRQPGRAGRGRAPGRRRLAGRRRSGPSGLRRFVRAAGPGARRDGPQPCSPRPRRPTARPGPPGPPDRSGRPAGRPRPAGRRRRGALRVLRHRHPGRARPRGRPGAVQPGVRLPGLLPAVHRTRSRPGAGTGASRTGTCATRAGRCRPRVGRAADPGRAGVLPAQLGARQLGGFYPSPAGATECALDLPAWERLAAAHPLLGAGRAGRGGGADLPRQARDGVEYFVVPIDVCYELAGRMRMLWRGFDGGSRGPGRASRSSWPVSAAGPARSQRARDPDHG